MSKQQSTNFIDISHNRWRKMIIAVLHVVIWLPEIGKHMNTNQANQDEVILVALKVRDLFEISCWRRVRKFSHIIVTELSSP